MNPTTYEPPTLPPPPPFALFVGPDGPDEMDVDLGDADDPDDDHDQGGDDDRQLRADTIVEGAEYLGSYPTLEAYFRAQLEPEISAGVQWLLDHVDYEAVQRRWEADGSRLLIEHGCIYKVGGAQ